MRQINLLNVVPTLRYDVELVIKTHNSRRCVLLLFVSPVKSH